MPISQRAKIMKQLSSDLPKKRKLESEKGIKNLAKLGFCSRWSRSNATTHCINLLQAN